MQIQDPAYTTPPVAAEVRPADIQPKAAPPLKVSVAEPGLQTLVIPITPSTAEDFITSAERTNEKLVANRVPGARVSLLYINGIRTNCDDANLAGQMIRKNFGTDENELNVLHNGEESIPVAWSKVCLGALSSRACSKLEEECVTELMKRVREKIDHPEERLILVGHSQGTQIIKNVFDRLHDEYHTSTDLVAKWEEGTKNIEIVLYAPLVRTIAPGPKAVSLTNSYDLAARSVGGISRSVDEMKHYTGYRPQETIHTIIYTDQEVRIGKILSAPAIVHSSFELILDDATFNFRRLSEDPKTRKPSPSLFATNLVESIRNGDRSDELHKKLITMGCDELKAPFARAFLDQCPHSTGEAALLIGKFKISDPLLLKVSELAALPEPATADSTAKSSGKKPENQKSTEPRSSKSWWKFW